MARLQQTIAVEGFALVVLPQELGDLSAQEQQGDEVRNDHDPVEEVRELPDQIDLQAAARQDAQHDDKLIGKQSFGAEEVTDVRLPEVIPADDRGEGEEASV